jgi:hypothetical protein
MPDIHCLTQLLCWRRELLTVLAGIVALYTGVPQVWQDEKRKSC